MAKSPHATTFIVLFIVCLVLSLPNLGMAVWALYDGTVYYPDLAERWQAYEQVKQDHPRSYMQQWPQVAAQNGWPTEAPKEYGEGDIVTQFVLMGFCGMIGLLLVISAVVFGLLWRRSEAKSSISQHGPT